MTKAVSSSPVPGTGRPGDAGWGGGSKEQVGMLPAGSGQGSGVGGGHCQPRGAHGAGLGWGGRRARGPAGGGERAQEQPQGPEQLVFFGTEGASLKKVSATCPGSATLKSSPVLECGGRGRSCHQGPSRRSAQSLEDSGLGGAVTVCATLSSPASLSWRSPWPPGASAVSLPEHRTKTEGE